MRTLLVTVLVAACYRDAPAPVASPDPVVVVKREAPAPVEEVFHAATPTQDVCDAQQGRVVRVFNSTDAPLDLCTIYRRALAKATQAPLGPGPFDLSFELVTLSSQRETRCKVKVGLDAGARVANDQGVAVVSTGGKLTSRERIEMAEDCIQALMESQLQRKIVPTLATTLPFTPPQTPSGPFPQPTATQPVSR